MLALADSLWVIYVARTLIGVSSGVYSALVPMYVGEIAEPRLRGSLGGVFQLAVITGLLLMYSLGIFMEWFATAYIGIAVSVVTAVVALVMPESPIWLARHGRGEYAFKVLTLLRGPQADIDQEIMAANESKSFNGNGPAYRDPTIVKPVILISLVMLFNQLCGVNIIVTYADQIFQSAGATFSSSISSLIIGLVMFLTTLASFPLIHWFNRRSLLLISLLTMSVSLGLFGGYLYLAPPGLDWVPILCLVVFIIAFSMGMGPLAWVLVSDLCIPQAAAAVGVFGSAVNWGLSFILTLGFSEMEALLTKTGTFWFYAFR